MQNLNSEVRLDSLREERTLDQPLLEGEDIKLRTDMTSALPAEKDRLYRYLYGSNTLPQLSTRVKTVLSYMGLTDFSHIKLEVPADALESYGTYSSDMIQQYRKEGFHLDDLALQYALSQPAPFFRSVIDEHIFSASYEINLFQRHMAHSKFLQKNGIHDVYNIPIVGDYSALFSVSIGNCPSALFKEVVIKHQRNLHVLARVVDVVGRTKFQKLFHSRRLKSNVLLCKSPLNLLAALAKDLTLNEAAEVAGISISTANQHIAEIKRRLQAYTTHGALLIALREGLITLD